MIKPGFYIVGAPKCGTTSLSEYLREHPQIFMSDPKEPFYFCTDLPGLCKVDSEAAYLDLFRTADNRHRAIGEASAVYMYSKTAAENILAFNEDARLIVMLRNPLDLVPSYHSQQLFALNEDEPDLERAWSLQPERAAGRSVPGLCRDAGVLRYHQIGLLGTQVHRLLSVFPRKQILFVLFDDFSADTRAVYRSVLQFLNVADDGRQSFRRFNPNKVRRFRFVESLRRTAAGYPRLNDAMRQTARRLGLTVALSALTQKPVRRSALSEDLLEKLTSAFADDVQLLSTLIQRDLRHWINDTLRVAAA